jgi:hypothetical protein
MAAATEPTTDRGIGLAMALASLAVIGAVGMYVGAPTVVAAWAFAAAMTFGVLLVVTVHLYWPQ